MDLNHPLRSIMGKNRARVVHVLAVLADATPGRRIHELSGNKSLATTQAVLEELVVIGLADLRRIGNANAYSLNRTHVLWAPLETILEIPAELENKIGWILRDEFGEHLIAAALFGSFARGTAHAESDVDILLVHTEKSPAQPIDDPLDRASGRIRALTGNAAQILTMTESEVRQLAESDDPFAASLDREARMLTDGPDLRDFLRGSA